MDFSIVIPAYNEENRIIDTLKKIVKFMSVNYPEYEIIVVDDGSSDATARTVKNEFQNDIKLKILELSSNRGKGYAVRKGILLAEGNNVLISDADMSAPIDQINKLIPFLDEGNDIVMASRAIDKAHVQIHQPWYREIMGKTFNLFVRMVVFKGFYDTQCGFKLINSKVAKELASIMKIDGFCFDVEMVFLALEKGYRVVEVGVDWVNSPDSKVKLFTSSLAMFVDLFKIKKMHKG